MSNEEKIIELTKRVEELEKAENKRIKKKKIKIAYELTKIAIIVGALLYGYIYINVKVIKPYKEKVDAINNKVDETKEYLNEKVDQFKSIFK